MTTIEWTDETWNGAKSRRLLDGRTWDEYPNTPPAEGER